MNGPECRFANRSPEGSIDLVRLPSIRGFGPLRFATHHYVALAILALLGSIAITGCKATKQTTKNQTPADSLRAEDTSRSEIDKAVDSVTSKISKFFSSFMPSHDTGRAGVDEMHPKSPLQAPVAQPSAIPSSTGFLSNPIKRRIEFDSAGNVIIHDQFLNSDVDTPTTMSLDDFLKQREDDELADGFKRTIHASADTSKIAEQGLFPTDFNTISIPIPPSIVPTIFGKPAINLKVNGDVAVHIAYRDNTFLATSGALFSGSESGLDFSQTIDVATTGTIGDKVKIGADWGSDRSFQFENLLHLGYTGYPDEILQSIEAGNVSLNTPSKYIGIQQALFGLKAVTRFGPVYVTELAAQKKGEQQSKTFGGGGGSTTAVIHPIQPAAYRLNNYFVDTAYIPYYEGYFGSATQANNGVTPTSLIVSNGSIEVWKSVPSIYTATPQSVRPAVAIYELGPKPLAGYPAALRQQSGSTGLVQSGYFIKLDTSQFQFNIYTGVVTLTQDPADQDAIAVDYQTAGGQYGEPGNSPNDTTLILKLVKPQYVVLHGDVPTNPAWNNLLKNSYYVGGAGFDPNQFTLQITYTQPTGAVTDEVRSATGVEKVITALGLDRVNNATGVLTPDNLFDVTNTLILNTYNGTVTFPYLQPFGSRILQYYQQQHRENSKVPIDSTFYFPQIYTTNPTVLITQGLGNGKNNQISINATFAGGVSSLINLNAFNLVQGSVRVTVNNQVLVENQDYRVDYNSGTIQILNPDLVTTGQVQVDYETNDIFTNSTKSLLALRAELPILDRGLIGLTFANYSMHLPTIKTRQGEEPLSNWMIETDASYHVPVPQVTDFLNYLPIFNLKEKSDLSFKVDAALSIPNPNTQISPMPVDNNAPIAYLDDFEGGENDFPLAMSYGRWAHASQPVAPEYSTLAVDTLTKMKGKTWWFQVFPQDVLETTIRPNEQTANPSDVAQVLDLCFDPTVPGAYNHHSTADFNGTDVTSRWGGMMQYLAGLSVPVTNTDAIELWVNIPEIGGNPDGELRFDMGQISEDVIPDGILESEDANRNGRYDPGEDIGLDTLSDASEKQLVQQGIWPNPNNPNDPSNDDYAYNNVGGTDPGVYENINGTEGNQNDQASLLHPDTEDLNGNNALDVLNNYYEYRIPLDMTKNKYVVGGNPTAGWYELKIPIAAFDNIVGPPDSSFSNISFFRFWLTGFSSRVRVRMNNITLVGSQWARALTGLNPSNPALDSTLKVSYVNIENNSAPPTNYLGPPGVARDLIPGQTTYIQGNEQSLDMSLANVPSGTAREVLRNFPTPNNLFNYKSMAIWVHGEESTINNTSPSNHDTSNQVWVYIKVGTNQYNYYEYRRPLTSGAVVNGVDSGWTNMHLDFGTMTSLKAARLPNMDTVSELANDGYYGSQYIVVGSPTLTNAPFFTLGVENETGASLTTNVWWDELRLLTPNVKPDYAMNASTTLKLAEFGKISASIVNERPDFVGLDQRFNPDHNLNFNWNVTGEFAMQKILPKWLEAQSSIPLTVSHTETILSPKYIPNTDIEVQSAVDKINSLAATGQLTTLQASQLADSIQKTSQTLDVKNAIASTGAKIVFPGSFFLLPAFLNRLVYGFGYSEEYARTPVYEYNFSWQWTGSLGYDLPKLPDVHLSPWTWWGTNTFFFGRYADWKINFLPQNIRFAISATRSRTMSLERTSTLEYPPDATLQDSLQALASLVPTINRVFTAKRGMQFQWKITEGGLLSPTIDYALDVTSNLTPLETSNTFNQVGYDSLGRPVYFYDSVYSTQRSWNQIMHDVFFKNGAFASLGNDFLEAQRINLTTNPRMPWFFGLEKYIKPVFSYHVDYKWQDAQTGLQISKTAAWNNTITTGLEFNVRDLGTAIFGKPGEANQTGGKMIRGRRDENPQPLTPEQLPTPGQEDRSSPPPGSNPSPRDQVSRGEDFRPQTGGNPLGSNNKFITDTLFRHQGAPSQPIDTVKRIHSLGISTEGERDEEYVNDTTLTPLAPPEDEVQQEPQAPPLTVKEVLQTLVEKPLFDWNGTRFNFIQNNSSLNPAVAGSGGGITNFLDRGVFSPEDNGNGPSRAYQLGLITDPEGRLLIGFKPTFPFVTFGETHGNRAIDPADLGSQITDVFTQQNNFELTTSRPLWTGANLSINWKLGFSYRELNTLNLDSIGAITPVYTARSGDVSRTFISIPPLPFLKISQSGINNVYNKYEQLTGAQGAFTPAQRAALPAQTLNQIEVQSFMQGFETIPMFSGFLREYLPRLNYSFNWTGLEKFPIFSFADHASFRNAYTGTYRRTFQQNPGDSVELTNLQTITYGFRPLAALDLAWDKIWGGRLTASFNYDTQSEWDADYSSQRINDRLSQTFGVTASWTSKGVSIPFLKLNVKNQVGASLTVSYTNSADSYYTFDNINTLPGGTGNGGLEKLTIEPRFSYSISQQLTIEYFFHYEETNPASTGQLAPATRLVTTGFDIHLKIQ